MYQIHDTPLLLLLCTGMWANYFKQANRAQWVLSAIWMLRQLIMIGQAL